MTEIYKFDVILVMEYVSTPVDDDSRETGVTNMKVYTMRELHEDTVRVIAEINEAGVPAAITKHGLYMVIITPLEHCEIESLVLSQDSEIVKSIMRRHSAEGPVED